MTIFIKEKIGYNADFELKYLCFVQEYKFWRDKVDKVLEGKLVPLQAFTIPGKGGKFSQSGWR